MPDGRMLSSLQGVLFDVDGTLVDSIEMCVLGLGDTFERFTGVRPRDEQIKSLVGIPLTKQLFVYDEEGYEPHPSEVEERVAFAISRYEAHRARHRDFPAAIAALEWCHDHGLKTGLVTSKNADELHRFLSHYDWMRKVDTAVCASDVRHPKPHPESIRLACSRLGIEPSRTAMVGDSVFDLRCARGAGAFAVAVSYGAAPREILSAEEPDLLFDEPDALLEWVKTLTLASPCLERN